MKWYGEGKQGPKPKLCTKLPARLLKKLRSPEAGNLSHLFLDDGALFGLRLGSGGFPCPPDTYYWVQETRYEFKSSPGLSLALSRAAGETKHEFESTSPGVERPGVSVPMDEYRANQRLFDEFREAQHHALVGDWLYEYVTLEEVN
jgi:hypothetical protein